MIMMRMTMMKMSRVMRMRCGQDDYDDIDDDKRGPVLWICMVFHIIAVNQ